MRFQSGNSGRSTGPHLDFRVWDPVAKKYLDPRPYQGRLRANGKSLTEQFQTTSDYGMRTHPVLGGQRMHHGIDYATPVGTEITFEGGQFIGHDFDKGGGGHMGIFKFKGQDGRDLEAVMLHGQDPGKAAPRAPKASSSTPSSTSKPAPAASTPTAPAPSPYMDQLAGMLNQAEEQQRTILEQMRKPESQPSAQPAGMPQPLSPVNFSAPQDDGGFIDNDWGFSDDAPLFQPRDRGALSGTGLRRIPLIQPNQLVT